MKEVEKEIESELPERFGFILDGWSEIGSGSHYVGIFAVYQSKERQQETPLSAFARWTKLTFQQKSHGFY